METLLSLMKTYLSWGTLLQTSQLSQVKQPSPVLKVSSLKK